MDFDNHKEKFKFHTKYERNIIIIFNNNRLLLKRLLLKLFQQTRIKKNLPLGNKTKSR